MKNLIKRALIATVAVAAVAGAYKSYTDYKQGKESDMVMQNIEALTGDDTGNPIVLDACWKEGGGSIGAKQYICQKGTTFFYESNPTPAVGAVIYLCKGKKDRPSITITNILEPFNGFCYLPK